MKTYSPKLGDITRKWYVIDASEASLGRVATRTASLLIGKSKPQISNHLDGGDYVVIINARNVKITGNKLQSKKYYHHSGYPSGLTIKTLGDSLNETPTDVLFRAVRGMLPVNKLRPGRLARLKIYADANHNHEAQQPTPISLKDQK